MELDGFKSGECALLLDLDEAINLRRALEAESRRPQSAAVDFAVGEALSLLNDHILHYDDPYEELD